MMKKKKQIIDLEAQRYGMFMSNNSFDLDVMYGRNFIETDNAQSVIIHKINVIETKTHNLYGQSKATDKVFMPGIRISVMVNVDDGQQSYYGEGVGGIVRDDTGNIKFGVYLAELEEKKLEIQRGDIIEYNMSGEKSRYYEVENANSVVDSTSKSIGGFKPYWKLIIGTPVKSDTVPFLNDTKGNEII
jgi:hypothetical protein